MSVGVLWARLKGLMRRRELDAELQDEMATHLELAAAENLRRGMPPEEARRLAAVRFGSVTSAREGAWDARGLAGLAYGRAALPDEWARAIARSSEASSSRS